MSSCIVIYSALIKMLIVLQTESISISVRTFRYFNCYRICNAPFIRLRDKPRLCYFFFNLERECSTFYSSLRVECFVCTFFYKNVKYMGFIWSSPTSFQNLPYHWHYHLAFDIVRFFPPQKTTSVSIRVFRLCTDKKAASLSHSESKQCLEALLFQSTQLHQEKQSRTSLRPDKSHTFPPRMSWRRTCSHTALSR